MLVTGNRLDDTRILATLAFFDISEGLHRVIDIKLRHDNRLQEIPRNQEPETRNMEPGTSNQQPTY